MIVLLENKMEGLITKQEKPSNTEVLGLLMDEEKLPFITNLNGNNVRGLCKLAYITRRLANPDRDPIEIHEEVISGYLALKCSIQQGKKGNRSDQIVDALKHIIDDENRTQMESIANSIRK